MDTASLVVGFLGSSVGFVSFVYGKRMRRLPQMVAGALLMACPFFLDGALALGVVSAALVALLVVAVRLGL